jgi:lysophospholipase L1-like esterase
MVIGVVLAIGALEIVVRLTGLAPRVRTDYGGNVHDAVIAYRRRPGATFRIRSPGEYDAECKHNSLGFRDTEHELVKPQGTFRIVALGDSFTYGGGAEYDETYTARTERALNLRTGNHPRIEIVNLGLPCHFPLLERLTLEHYGLQFSPDLVTVAVLPNDVLDTEAGLEAVCVSDEGYLVSCAALWWGEAGVRVLVHSAVARMLLAWWIRRSHVPIESGDSPYRDEGPYEAAWRKLEGELARMQELARRAGAGFALIFIPQHPPWTDSRNSYTEERLVRWSAANDAPFISTLPALRTAESGVPLYWKIDGHATPAGYEVIANAIVARLSERGFVP